jgi:ribosomal protein L28
MKKCAICQKKSKKAGIRKKLRGHYNPTGKRKQLPNLQWVKLPDGKRIRICTKCLKRLEKNGNFEI